MSRYKIGNFEEYFKEYKKSIKDPKKFWEKIASENFTWYQEWSKVVDFNMAEAEIKWFVDAKVNITKNCIDRHLIKKGDKPAIIFEPNNPEEATQTFTYNELHQRVNKMANVLLSQGIQKGDRVCIYLPMIPELAITTLACARIGAIHSVIYAEFSASAISTRINDSKCKMVITSDGGYRGNKTIDLKGIVDEAIINCPSIEKVLVVNRTNTTVQIKEGRDQWLAPLLENASDINTPEIMDAEDPLFILYTTGSTEKTKGIVHTTAGYMVYTAYTFQNIFNYEENDIFWCTADIGWITGHSYTLYGPLLNGGTTVIFEGISSYPDFSRYWKIIEKHKVNQFYTTPIAIRSLAKESLDYVQKYPLKSLKVIGSVGEPINEEAWHWYNDHVGGKRCPVVDTWWQTETGGILISPLPFITPTKPTYSTLPLPGIQVVLMDEKRNEIEDNQVVGNLCIKYPWPGIARTIWGDHDRYKKTYFSTFPGKYFSGDCALRDEVGYYRITGSVEDVINISGRNLGSALIEDAINEHLAVVESAIVNFPLDKKEKALYGFVILKETGEKRDKVNLAKEINQHISEHISPLAQLNKIQFVSGLPKTRSGKITRSILRKIAEEDYSNFGDTSNLLNPEIIDEIKKGKL